MPTYFEMAGRCENGEPVAWTVVGTADYGGDQARASVEQGTIIVARQWEEDDDWDEPTYDPYNLEALQDGNEVAFEAWVQSPTQLVIEGGFMGLGVQEGDIITVTGGTRRGEAHIVTAVNGGEICIQPGTMLDANGQLLRLAGHPNHHVDSPGPRRVEVPQFEVLDQSNQPTFSLAELRETFERFPPVHHLDEHHPASTALLRSTQVPVPDNLTQDLSGTTWHIRKRWRPLTEQKAREGVLRLLKRRLETQPLTWFERVAADELF